MENKKLVIYGIIVLVAILLGILFVWFNFPKEEPVIIDDVEIVKQKITNEIAKYDYTLKSEQEIIEQIKTLGQNNLEILAELTGSNDKATRYLVYIALSGLTNTLPEKRTELIAILKKGLADSDATIKVQVAQLVVYWGEKDGIQVLIDSLDKNEEMIPSEPPTTVNFYSHMILAGHTSVDFGYDKIKWQSWWDANQNKLNWDSQIEKFK